MASSPTIPRSSLALRRIALLEGLSDERLDLLAQHCSWHSVGAGKPLLPRRITSPSLKLLSARRIGDGFAELLDHVEFRRFTPPAPAA